jgi:hypothetical protein
MPDVLKNRPHWEIAFEKRHYEKKYAAHEDYVEQLEATG